MTLDLPTINRLRALRVRLRDADRAYYVLDSPTMSDAEYDLVKDELEALEDAFPVLWSEDSPFKRRIFERPNSRVLEAHLRKRQSVSFLGVFTEPLGNLIVLAAKGGLVVHTKVTKLLGMAVVGDLSQEPDRQERARTMGVPVVSEDVFRAILEARAERPAPL